MLVTVEQSELYRIIYTDHEDPFQVLGAHEVSLASGPALAVRAFLPDASEAFVLERREDRPRRHRMTLVHPYGFFEAILPGRGREGFQYELERVDEFGQRERFLDSYAFEPTLTDFDLHLFGEGHHYRIFEKLGSHIITIAGVSGVQFAVWAPHARSVSVIGSFNGWDRRKHPMRRLNTGVWEIFVPGLGEGDLYKYQIKTHQDTVLDKADPYAIRHQVAPRTASVVHQLRPFAWTDQTWIESRQRFSCRTSPMSIYEVHLGSWLRSRDPGAEDDRPLSYRELIPILVPYLKELGYTHVELMPVMEHPFAGSWGYQVTGYYATSSRQGTPEDLMALIDAFHQEGIGVILDWVPAHFPKDIHALGRFDGTAVYEHLDPRQGEHQDWGTYIFNYGRNQVRNFLIGSALFWIEQLHADGLRVDALTSMLHLNYSRAPGQWVPNKFGGPENLDAIEFVRELNAVVQEYHPGVFVTAEESTSWPGVTRPAHLGGLGFDLKWNMGWMNDTLAYFSQDPIHRKFQHQKLTFSIWYAFNEAYVLPLSHDEVVHLKRALVAKMPGDAWKQYANLRLLFGYQYGHPGKKLLFMGGEIAQWREWNHDRSLDWFLTGRPAHRGIRTFVSNLNRLYREEPALWELDASPEGFEWIDFADAGRSIIAFLRHGDDARRETLLFVLNFTPVPRHAYRVGVPLPGTWLERLNSDAEVYGGSNVGNYGAVHSEPVPMHQRAHSLSLSLPPLGMLVLKRAVTAEDEARWQLEAAAAQAPGAVSGAVVSVEEARQTGPGSASKTGNSAGQTVQPRSPDQEERPGLEAPAAASLTAIPAPAPASAPVPAPASAPASAPVPAKEKSPADRKIPRSRS